MEKPVKQHSDEHVGDENRFVRNEYDKESGARFSLSRAFLCAGVGFANAVRTQRNMKVHLIIAATAVALGFAFAIDAASWMAIVVCIVLVIALECLNTAVESVVDLVSPSYHDLARRAKDCAAAAVFMAALGSVAVACIVFIPHLIAFMGL